MFTWFHRSVSNLRLRSIAKSRSDFGVFCDFFMKPWSKTISPSAMQNSTRAILLPARFVLTSLKPLPHRTADRHPDGLSVLDRLDVGSDKETVLLVQGLEPFSD